MTANDCLSIDFGTYRVRASYCGIDLEKVGPRVSTAAESLTDGFGKDRGQNLQSGYRLVKFTEHESFMPSLVSVNNENKLSFGRDAALLSTDSSLRCSVARILENINSPSPILVRSFTDVSDSGFTAKEILVELVKHIKKISEEQAGRTFKLVALSFPYRIFRSAAKINAIMEALKRAGFEDAEVCDDCTALRVACGHTLKTLTGHALIIDWGYSALRLYLVKSVVRDPQPENDDVELDVIPNGCLCEPSLSGEQSIHLVEKYMLASTAAVEGGRLLFSPDKRFVAEKILLRLHEKSAFSSESKQNGEFSVTREQLSGEILGTYRKEAVDAMEKMVRSHLSDGQLETVYASGPLCELLKIGDLLNERGVCSSTVYSGANDEIVMGTLRYAVNKINAMSTTDQAHAVLDNLSIETQRADLISKACEKHLKNGKCCVWYGKEIPEKTRIGAKRFVSLDQQMVLVCDSTALCSDGSLGFVLGVKGIAYRSNPSVLPWKTKAGFIRWEDIKTDGVYYITTCDGNRELVIHETDKQGGHHIDVNCSLSQDPNVARTMVTIIKQLAETIRSKFPFVDYD